MTGMIVLMGIANYPTDEVYDLYDDALRPRLTPEFLDVLGQAARTVGWSVDYTEVHKFVRECFYLAGQEMPDSMDRPYIEQLYRRGSP